MTAATGKPKSGWKEHKLGNLGVVVTGKTPSSNNPADFGNDIPFMVIVRRTLNKYGYPPDKQQKAVDTVMKQAEVLADYWVDTIESH